MKFPEFLFIFSLLPLLYIARKSKKERSRSARVKKLGIIFDQAQIPFFYIAGALGIGLGIIAYFMRRYISDTDFAAMAELGHVKLIYYSTWDPEKIRNIVLVLLSEIYYAAIGEEFFFRGYIGGKLYRRYGFLKGNILQTLIFILPYIYYQLMTSHSHIYAYIPLMVVMSWLCGWLRYKSKSIFPAILLHGITTAVVGYTLML